MRLRVAFTIVALGGAALAGAVATQRAWSQGPQQFQRAPALQHTIEADPVKLLERIVSLEHRAKALEQKATALETRFAKHKHEYQKTEFGLMSCQTFKKEGMSPGCLVMFNGRREQGETSEPRH